MNQNLYGSQSNVNRLAIGGVSRPSVLPQVRDQTSPGPGLTVGCKTLRTNNGRSYYNEVNNQNLPGFNLTQDNINDVVDDLKYQPMYCSDKFLNPYRVGLDLATQEDQGEFNSHPIIHQLGTGSATGSSNTDSIYVSW